MRDLKYQFIIEADKPNKNQRVYSKSILQNIVDNFVPVPGMIGNPSSSIIPLHEISHTVTKMFFIRDKLYANISILSTPAGKLLDAMFDQKLAMAFRLSGVGNGKVSDGKIIIDPSYKFISLCAYPAHEAS